MKPLLLNTMLISLLTIPILAAAEDQSSIPPIEQDKAQIVVYRGKSAGGGLGMYMYNISDKITESTKTESGLVPFEDNDGMGVGNTTFLKNKGDTVFVERENADKYSKNLSSKKTKRFDTKDYEVFNTAPGTYRFWAATSAEFYNRVKEFKVYTIYAEPGKQYFIRSEVFWGGITGLTFPPPVDAKAELEWEKDVPVNVSDDLFNLSIEKICSSDQLQDQNIKQLSALYNSNKKIYAEGKTRIKHGNLKIFLAMPLTVVGAATIGTLLTVSTENVVPIIVAIPIGGGMGFAFLINGSRQKKQGKSEMRNSVEAIKDIKLKVEASCNKVSLNIEF